MTNEQDRGHGASTPDGVERGLRSPVHAPDASAASPLFQKELLRPGTWHSHKDGFWLFVWNEETKRWECSGCGEPWA